MKPSKKTNLRVIKSGILKKHVFPWKQTRVLGAWIRRKFPETNKVSTGLNGKN